MVLQQEIMPSHNTEGEETYIQIAPINITNSSESASSLYCIFHLGVKQLLFPNPSMFLTVISITNNKSKKCIHLYLVVEPMCLLERFKAALMIILCLGILNHLLCMSVGSKFQCIWISRSNLIPIPPEGISFLSTCQQSRKSWEEPREASHFLSF